MRKMEDSQKTYPVSYSDSEIKGEIDSLSRRLQSYKRTDILDDLIKDAVIFNLGYNELQNRENRRHSNYMLVLAFVSGFVAIASFVVAWLAYKSTEVNTAWQDQQTRALSEIRNGIATLKEGQAKPTQKNKKKETRQAAPNNVVEPTR